MNRKTISKEFANMYGDGKPLNYRTNKSINNLLREIPNKNFENDVNVSKKLSELNLNSNVNIDSESDSVPYGLIIFIIILLLLILMLYYYKDKIIASLSKIGEMRKKDEVKADDINNKLDALSKKEDATNVKLDEFIHKHDKNNINTKEVNDKLTQNKVDAGGVQQLNNKIDTLTSYKQEQLVKENSYCYIGTENGQRECTNVFDGDICMSGQIFPKMAICINPHLRP